MAFLGRPNLSFGTPHRSSPTSPGSVPTKIEVPFFVETLERCFIRGCDDSVNAPVFEIVASIWSTDRSEPAGTSPIGRDRELFKWYWTGIDSIYKRISGQQILDAVATNRPHVFGIYLNNERAQSESSLNEDWGPFPPPGKSPLVQTQDELFLRVQLSSLFSAWSVIQTVDSNIVNGQFFGP